MSSLVDYRSLLLAKRLDALLVATQPKKIIAFFDGLSHGDFRKASYIMSHQVLVLVSLDQFWVLFVAMVSHNSKAFLGTMLVAARIREDFSLKNSGFMKAAQWLNEKGSQLDRDKFVRAMVDIFAHDVDELRTLFSSLHIDEPELCVRYLLVGHGFACYYLLFNAMRRIDGQRELLVRCCRYLMIKGDTLSFNLAGAAKQYFDLPEVGGTFSLRLFPYQLSALESGIEDFTKVLSSI